MYQEHRILVFNFLYKIGIASDCETFRIYPTLAKFENYIKDGAFQESYGELVGNKTRDFSTDNIKDILSSKSHVS